MTHEEVVKYIQEGNILQPPDGCPVKIYELMRLCFQSNPSNRPTFRTVYLNLEEIHREMEQFQANQFKGSQRTVAS